MSQSPGNSPQSHENSKMSQRRREKRWHPGGEKKKESVQETGKGTRKGKSLGKDLGGDLSVHKKAAQSMANFRPRSMLFPFSWKSHKKKNGRNTEVKVGICTDSYLAKHTTTSGTTERNYGLQPSSCGYWALLPVP